MLRLTISQVLRTPFRIPTVMFLPFLNFEVDF